MKCPCGSKKDYPVCCEPIIRGEEKAKTAEQLMRARYSAYSKIELEFVESSHDPKTRDQLDMDANRQWAESTKWLGLEIVETKDGLEGDAKGYVQFVAKYDSGNGEEEHHEFSEFSQKDGNWYFVDSKDPRLKTVVREGEKVGRNDPCPCGSGKKFKKCCGNN